MSLALDDGDVRLYVGDAREQLSELPDESVHCVATSPPFFGLRDYGTGRWEGGDPDCDHERPSTTMNVGFNERWGQGGGEKRQERKSGGQYAGSCPKCGADRIDSQIGLEATPDAWAASIVDVLREARRVLRSDGSLWIECGDSYASTPGSGTNVPQTKYPTRSYPDAAPHRSSELPGIKPTDLVLAPMLLAMALRADGWYLRGAYIWEKPDAMPESVENRCTTSHSFVFHLTKNSEDAVFWTHRDGAGTRRRPKPDYRWIHRETGEEAELEQEGREWKRLNLWRGRPYFFDRDAIREPFSDYSTGGGGGSYGSNADAVRTTDSGPRGSTRYERPPRPQDDGGHVQPTLDGDILKPEVRGPDGRRALNVEAGENSHQHRDGNRWPSLDGRSPRSVWRITTEASSFGLCPVCRTYWPERAPARHCGADVVAHFAVWPHALVGKIIEAATSEAGCCADCAAPRIRRVVRDHETTAANGLGRRDVDGYGIRDGVRVQSEHLGWQATCECDAATVPCIVLDVFGGSGTTARQARKLGRHAILIELSPDYAEIAAHRLSQQALDLTAA